MQQGEAKVAAATDSAPVATANHQLRHDGTAVTIAKMFVPANKKWYRNLVVARTIADTLEAMDPRYPPAEKGLDDLEVPD